MLYLSICATLLTIIAAMHLLAKTRTESLGSFFKWVSYLVLIVASLALVCQVTRAVCKMCCHKACKEKMHGDMGRCGGHHEMMMRKEMHMHGKGACCHMEKMHEGMGKDGCKHMKCEETETCEGHKKGGAEHHEMPADSAAHH